jgi:hypothetical protein
VSLPAAPLMASAAVYDALLRLLGVSRGSTQADIVERAEGTFGVARISPIERGEWPMLSTRCTAIARALGLTDEGQSPLRLLARTDRAPERLKPMPRRARFGFGLHALRRSSPPRRRPSFMS